MNKIKEVLEKELKNVKPSSDELKNIRCIVDNFLELIIPPLKKVNAEIMVGGSFAKNTLIKKKKYDVDFFVRFNYDKYGDKSSEISKILSGVLAKISKQIKSKPKLKIETIHGSRDYFGITFTHLPVKISFEIIPVLSIRKSEEAINVTDTSPLHVRYIKKHILNNDKLADEIRLMKAFCYANDCYGAESHIKGFSGYALELLTCYYKSFFNTIKAVSKWKKTDKIILDPENFYKKGDIVNKLNKSKLQSPLILIDPTQKDRNATASLDKECFVHFINSCKSFYKKPLSNFFVRKDKLIDITKFKTFAQNKKAKLIVLDVQSNKKREDIAGAKLFKFFTFLSREFTNDFDVLKSDWAFNEDEKKAIFAFVLLSKKEIIVRGPPIHLKEHADKFKKRHKDYTLKNKVLYSKRKPRKVDSIFELVDLKILGIKKINKLF